MTDAWHEAQQAIRALRKDGDIRTRLIEAYRALVKMRGKDLPNEVRHDHGWLIGAIDTRPSIHLHAEIQNAVSSMSPSQLSEAVHRILKLHDSLRAYQPVVVPTPQKLAACRALRSREGQAGETMACADCTQCKLF